jgi:hypothetical protein
MNHALLRAADKLALAPKQVEQARRNLRQVQIWANRHDHPHLAQGTLDLVQGMAKLSGDLQTLVGVVRAQASGDQSEGPIHPL